MLRSLTAFCLLFLAGCSFSQGPDIWDVIDPDLSIQRSSPRWGGHAPGDSIRLRVPHAVRSGNSLYKISGKPSGTPHFRAGTVFTVKSASITKFPVGDNRRYWLRLECDNYLYTLSIEASDPDRLFNPSVLKEEGLEMLPASR
jgi:hypothetical protein